jgi:hypothetical protein
MAIASTSSLLFLEASTFTERHLLALGLMVPVILQ